MNTYGKELTTNYASECGTAGDSPCATMVVMMVPEHDPHHSSLYDRLQSLNLVSFCVNNSNFIQMVSTNR